MTADAPEAAPRTLRVTFRAGWDPAGEGKGPRGLFRPDPRARTLLKVLVSYPEVRFVLPDRVSLDGFLTTARRVLPRRSVEVTDVMVAALTALYRTATET